MFWVSLGVVVGVLLTDYVAYQGALFSFCQGALGL